MFEALKRFFQQSKTSHPEQKHSDSKDSACDSHASSTPDRPDSEGKLSSNERLAFLAEKGIKILQENWRENIQEKGHKRYFVAFDVPETDHEGILKLEKETRIGQEESWLLSIGVHQKGSSRLHSHFLCHGDGQKGLDQVLAYLARPELKMELVVSVKELSHHVWLDD